MKKILFSLAALAAISMVAAGCKNNADGTKPATAVWDDTAKNLVKGEIDTLKTTFENDVKAGAKESNDGSDVEKTNKWYRKADLDKELAKFDTAKTEVESAKDKAAADAIVKALPKAADFLGGLQNGTKPATAVWDDTAKNLVKGEIDTLKTTFENDVKAGAKESNDGSDVEKTNKWYRKDVLDKELAKFDTAKTEVESAKDKAAADAIVKALPKAADFLGGLQNGTKR